MVEISTIAVHALIVSLTLTAGFILGQIYHEENNRYQSDTQPPLSSDPTPTTVTAGSSAITNQTITPPTQTSSTTQPAIQVIKAKTPDELAYQNMPPKMKETDQALEETWDEVFAGEKEE